MKSVGSQKEHFDEIEKRMQEIEKLEKRKGVEEILKEVPTRKK